MEGTYPLRIDGETVGELKVTVQGALTGFDVACTPLPGIVRVSVYGGGREGYLGVLAPEDGMLTLHKKLSRAALRDFPAQIETAERAGRAEIAAAPVPAAAPEPAAAEESAAPEELAQTVTAGTAPAEETPPAEPPAGPVPETVEDLYWYSSPDGVLVCFDGEQNLIALPEGDPRIPARGGEARTVEGRAYVVFRTKNGRLVY